MEYLNKLNINITKIKRFNILFVVSLFLGVTQPVISKEDNQKKICTMSQFDFMLEGCHYCQSDGSVRKSVPRRLIRRAKKKCNECNIARNIESLRMHVYKDSNCILKDWEEIQRYKEYCPEGNKSRLDKSSQSGMNKCSFYELSRDLVKLSSFLEPSRVKALHYELRHACESALSLYKEGSMYPFIVSRCENDLIRYLLTEKEHGVKKNYFERNKNDLQFIIKEFYNKDQ